MKTGTGEVWKEGITRKHEEIPFGGEDMFTTLTATMASQMYTYVKTPDYTLIYASMSIILQ